MSALHSSNVELITDDGMTRMAPIIYKSEGERIAKKLWDELMDELSFTGVRDIILGLEK